jgi:hypothetical protein
MPSERPSTPAFLLWALSALLAAMVFFFVLGSGSEQRLTSLGHSGRWALLVGVWCVAAYIFVFVARRNATDRIPVYAVAALALPLLGVVSAAWSVAPKTTVGRALSLALLASASLFVAYASVFDTRIAGHVLGGLLAGTATAGLAGALLLFVDHDAAVQSAGGSVAARYRGLGENPNTYSMLAAVALPIAVWALLEAKRDGSRAAAGLSAMVLLGSISFSGSRGAFLAALLGMVAFAVARPRGRVLVDVPAVAGVFAVSFLLALIPQPVSTPPVAGAPPGGQPQAGAGQGAPGPSGGSARPGGGPPLPASISGYNPARLQDEEGRPITGNTGNIARPLLGSSGRATAWTGAVKQANHRAVAGYGFGTEDLVFVDRFYFFQGARPENSWVGIYLQLGALGILMLLVFWLSLVPAAWSTLRRRGSEADAALLGVCAAALFLTVPQSYFYSVGNVATATTWFAAGLLAFSTLRAKQGDERDEAR